jgi:surfactin synthase thioesterase subunit
MTIDKHSYERFNGGSFGLRHLRPVKEPGTSLICFPHAGGQSLSFRPLAEHLDEDRAIAALDPPGHGWSNATPHDDIDLLVTDYWKHMPRELFQGAVLLGHSMGGYVAMALAHRLADAHIPVSAVVISGTRPPHRRADFRSLVDLPDDRLFEELKTFSELPKELFMQFLSAIRADFRAFENWAPPTGSYGTRTLILGGVKDRFCLPHHLLEWDRYFTDCRFAWVDGGHLFLQSHPEESARKISDFLRVTS